MLILKFSVRNQRLSRFNSATVAANSVGYLHCQFNFLTEDWNDVSVKIANFSYHGRNYPRQLDENNMCEVPPEVIKPNSEFKVSVFGGGITTNTIKIPVEDSGMTSYDDGVASLKYYNEIINKLSATIDELNETKADNIIYDEEDNTIQLSANGTPIGDKVVSGSCGIKDFEVTDDDKILVTLHDGRVIDLGAIEGASGVTFIPHISDDYILSWTNNGGLPNPDPVDLNHFDEWVDDDGQLESDYIWVDE
jgi:hypothetical protein